MSKLSLPKVVQYRHLAVDDDAAASAATESSAIAGTDGGRLTPQPSAGARLCLDWPLSRRSISSVAAKIKGELRGWRNTEVHER